MRRKPTYIDLFSGCGGLSLGLHKSGWQGLFAIEKNKDAFLTLKHNLIDKKNHFDWPDWLPVSENNINDVIKNNQEELMALRGQVDMVAGGPPCQGFSTAGLRQEGDLRNGLIRSYLRFISYTRPKVLFFENVSGFTLEFKENKTKGIAYSTYVVRVLKWLGYDVHSQMVDFSKFGVPQKRVRFILVGVRRDSDDQPNLARVFFKRIKKDKREFLISKNLKIRSSLEQAISDLLYEHGKINSPDTNGFKAGIYTQSCSGYQDFMRKGVEAEFPDSHRFVNHRKPTIKKFKYILSKAERNKSINKKIRLKLKSNKHTIIPLGAKMPSPTLTTLPDDYIHYCEPRILTVREYARIQSFPDWYEFKGKYTTGGPKRTEEVPRYSQIGNAIPPLFGEQAGVMLSKIALNG